MMYRTFGFAALLGILLVQIPLMSVAQVDGTSEAEPVCDFPIPNNAYCDSNRYAMKFSNHSGPEDYCDHIYEKYCMLDPINGGPSVPPSPPHIDCESHLGSDWRVYYTCEAWPQGDLLFDWSVTPGLKLESTPGGSDAHRTVRCEPESGDGSGDASIGTGDDLYVSVVIHALGGTSTAYKYLECGTL